MVSLKTIFRRPPAPPKARGANRERGAKAPLLLQTASGFLVSQVQAPALVGERGVESIHELANLMVAGHFAEGRRGLAVCAAAEGSGATFVATNLAGAIARLGVQTLLIETNLRTPRLVEAVKPPVVGPGLSDYLLDTALVASDIVTEEVIPNLRVVYAGTHDPQAVDLLSNDRFGAFVAECLRDNTCTILDTAAANRSPDARIAAQSVGYALLVARRKRSFIEDVETLASQLSQDGVSTVGSILNGS